MERIAYDHGEPQRKRINEIYRTFEAQLQEVIRRRSQPGYFDSPECIRDLRSLLNDPARRALHQELEKMALPLGGVAFLRSLHIEIGQCAGCTPNQAEYCESASHTLDRAKRSIARDVPKQAPDTAGISASELARQANALCAAGKLEDAVVLIEKGKLNRPAVTACTKAVSNLTQKFETRCKTTLSAECDDLADNIDAMNFALADL